MYVQKHLNEDNLPYHSIPDFKYRQITISNYYHN